MSLPEQAQIETGEIDAALFHIAVHTQINGS
jgi:hypothetical protein